MLDAPVRAHVATTVPRNSKVETMKIATLLRKLPVFLMICALGLTASSALAKGKEKTGAKGKHGREAGELPYGLERHTEKKGELPSGLEKKKDEEGQLTRGLEEGGKNSKALGKGKKSSK